MQIAENLSSSRNNGNAVLPAVLRLTLTKKWFDMIARGEKKEEYRAIKSYWNVRLLSSYKDANGFIHDGNDLNWFYAGDKPVFKNFDFVEFKNGYSKTSPTILVECKGIKVGNTKPEWSEFASTCFVIELGKLVLPAV